MAKQAALEAVQSERSSLLLQLERVSKMQENDRTTPENGMNSTRVLLNITDDGKYPPSAYFTLGPECQTVLILPYHNRISKGEHWCVAPDAPCLLDS